MIDTGLQSISVDADAGSIPVTYNYTDAYMESFDIKTNSIGQLELKLLYKFASFSLQQSVVVQ